MNTAAVGLLWGYRLFLSPLLHQMVFWRSGCRFTPTCSDYGLAAIRQYGPASGFVLILKRLVRCHPFSAGGGDTIPERTLDGVKRIT